MAYFPDDQPLPTAGAAIVKRGMNRSSNPGYGWAVPNWTYNASQYAPGPRPAPAWPKSSYSVYGGIGDFMAESSEFRVPNWALAAGAGYALYRMHNGKYVPVRKNFVITTALLGTIAIWAVGMTAAGTAAGMVGNAFKGMSGAGLFGGMALGALYGMKQGQKLPIAMAMGGGIVGWGMGMAYEKSQQPDEEAGIFTSVWDVFI